MMSLLVVLLAGIAVALIRRRLKDPAAAAGRVDPPARLLGWAAGLLAAERHDWGQAMVGELDRLDGRARRWRFAIGCVGAALVLPPWGRAAAAIGGLIAVAAAGGGAAVYAHVHYRLGTDGWTWVDAAIVVVLLAGYLLAGSVLLRRPGVAAPGLIGGLAVAVVWLAVSGFTFTHFLNKTSPHPWVLFAVPIAVGVGGTLWGGGSAAAGRRAARLAAVSAGLALYLYGVLAVAVIGARGHPTDDGWTAAAVISDDLANQVTFSLVALPLVTIAVGWAAAAATAGLRRAGPASAPRHPLLPAPAGGPAPAVEGRASRPAREDHPHPGDGTPGAIRAATPRRRRTGYVLLLCAVLAAAVVLAFVGILRG